MENSINFPIAIGTHNQPKTLLFLMSVFSQTFFTFVGSHFVSFTFFTAWHNDNFLNVRFTNSVIP